jgi:putative FmdB family regulatory protein
MPVYEYHCHTCGKYFSVQAKIADAPPARGLDCVSNKCVLEKKISLIASPRKSEASSSQMAEPAESSAQPDRQHTKHPCGGGCSH